MELLSKYFKFKEKNTNVKSETIGALTTFLTMAYALFLTLMCEILPSSKVGDG
ncbi:MAG: hypothetical protein MJ191_02725 [Clostridium sp.]|nr:hypothetical protein [Clostridium sp.]